MRTIQRYAWCVYLGMSLNLFAELHFYDWKFYAIIIPLIFLETFKDFKIKKS